MKRGRLRPATVWIPATIAVLLCAALLVAIKTPKVALVDRAALTVTPQQAPLSLGTPTVRYSVAGSGRAQVTYITDRGDLYTAQVELPWNREIVFPSPMRPASLTVTSSGLSALTCRIVVDGASRADQTGSEGTVVCSVVAI
jgi:hypothetical protein